MHSETKSSPATLEDVTDIRSARAASAASHEEVRTDLGKISTLVSRNVTIGGHRTSCRLEPFMWDALYDICARERVTIHTLCTRISERKDANTSLTAAIRVFALAYFRAASTEEGHMRAAHGNGNPFTQTPFDNGEQPTDPVVSLRRSVG
jgi:predicted DNA-binding ribbon-helix-helix protein